MTVYIPDSALIEDSPYQVVRLDRGMTRGGGVLVLVHNSVKFRQIELQNSEMHDILEIQLNDGDFRYFIFVVYRPPNPNKNRNIQFIELIRHLCEPNSNKRLLFFGDFNYPSIDWINMTASGLAVDRDFVSMVAVLGLDQLVTDSIRGGHILDLVLTNCSNCFSNLQVCN